MNNLIDRLREMQRRGIGFLGTPKLSELTDKSEAHYERARCTGEGGPVFTKIGRSVKYSLDDIIEWLEKMPRFTSTSESVEDAKSKRPVPVKEEVSV